MILSFTLSSIVISAVLAFIAKPAGLSVTAHSGEIQSLRNRSAPRVGGLSLILVLTAQVFIIGTHSFEGQMLTAVLGSESIVIASGELVTCPLK